MAPLLTLEDIGSVDVGRRREAVLQGLPTKMVRALLKSGEVTLGDLARVIAPRRTLERRLKDGERLNVDESDRLARFLKLLALCEHIFGGRAKAIAWLRRPLWVLGDMAPIDLIRTSAGADEVEDLLERGRHGMLA